MRSYQRKILFDHGALGSLAFDASDVAKLAGSFRHEVFAQLGEVVMGGRRGSWLGLIVEDESLDPVVEALKHVCGDAQPDDRALQCPMEKFGELQKQDAKVKQDAQAYAKGVANPLS